MVLFILISIWIENSCFCKRTSSHYINCKWNCKKCIIDVYQWMVFQQITMALNLYLKFFYNLQKFVTDLSCSDLIRCGSCFEKLLYAIKHSQNNHPPLVHHQPEIPSVPTHWHYWSWRAYFHQAQELKNDLLN